MGMILSNLKNEEDSILKGLRCSLNKQKVIKAVPICTTGRKYVCVHRIHLTPIKTSGAYQSESSHCHFKINVTIHNLV